MAEASSAAPRQGAIVFISMKNFMTFKNVELTPNLGFNMILGPNGAGKSTIVSAITLGLGGDIGTLRRQRSLVEFINTDTDAEKAEIRLKLYRSSEAGCKDHYDVLCKLYKNGRSTFELDGKVVQKSDVVTLASRLKIQTNNLCQFLPQDVVREFPSMSPEKMFENTIQAAGKVSLLHKHNELKKAQHECKQLQVSLEQRRNTLQDLSRKAEAAATIQNAVSDHEERQRIIKLLRLQEKYLYVDMLHKDVRRAMKEMKNCEDKARKAAAEVERSGSFLASYEAKKASLMKKMKSNASVVTAMAGQLRGHKVAEFEEELKGIARELESLELEKGNSRQKVRELEEKLAISRPQLEDLKRRDPSSEIVEAKNRLREVAIENGPLKNNLSNADRDLHQISLRLGSLQKRKSHLSSMDEKRLKQLRSLNSDAYEGVQWLRGNGNRFSQPVHEPIANTINLVDDKYAVYVERLVGKLDLEAFLCEDSRDATSLMNALRGAKKLRKINVVHSQRESFKTPEAPLRNLDRFVSQMFECPPAVMAYLCRRKQLHRIPVFLGSCDHPQVQRQFKIYFVDKQMYTCSKGRYSGQVRTKVQDCSHDTPKHLAVAAVDKDELAAVNKEIDQVQMEEVECSKRLGELKERLCNAESKKNRIEENIEEMNQQISKMNRLRREIQSMEHAIVSLKENEKSDREKKTKRKEELQIARKKAVLQQAGAALDFQKFAKANLDASVEVQKYKAFALYLEAKNKQNNRCLDEAKANLELTEQERSKTDAKYKKLGGELSKKYNELTWATKGRMERPPEIEREITAHCPDNLAQVRAQLQVAEKSAQGERTYTAEEISKARQAVEKKEKAEAELRQLELGLQEKLGAAKELEKSTLQRVDGLIEAVGQKFSELMASMGNVGSIKLHKADDVLDFKSYGLHIMVKFAGHRGEMQKLANNVQSGGEKSVATALYMMALQELSVVPFALLDEINQGMDDDNERKVWEMLLQTATRSGAQYFYLAPKFPKHLEFNDDMTVLFCFKGSVKKSSSQHKREKK